MTAVEPRTEAQVVNRTTFAAMERWVRWRNGVDGGMVTIGGSSAGLLGRLQEGGRYNKRCPRCEGKRRIKVANNPAERTCPDCGGFGKVAVDLAPSGHVRVVQCSACLDKKTGRGTGQVKGATCIKCRGSGERIEAKHYVHPATIPGTRHLGRDSGDPVAELVNRTVYGWRQQDATWWMFAVVIEYYSPDEPQNGRRSQEQMAACLGTSDRWFRKKLKEAHLTIQDVLERRDSNRAY